MANFQARIKPEYRQRFPQFEADYWYDVEPLRPDSKTRGSDLFGNRIVRLNMGDHHTAIRSEYFELRSTNQAEHVN